MANTLVDRLAASYEARGIHLQLFYEDADQELDFILEGSVPTIYPIRRLYGTFVVEAPPESQRDISKTLRKA